MIGYKCRLLNLLWNEKVADIEVGWQDRLQNLLLNQRSNSFNKVSQTFSTIWKLPLGGLNFFIPFRIGL